MIIKFFKIFVKITKSGFFLTLNIFLDNVTKFKGRYVIHKFFIICFFTFILNVFCGCVPFKNSSDNLSSQTPLPEGYLVPEPKVIDINYDEVFVTRTTQLPVNTRIIKLTEMDRGKAQNYFLEDRIVFSEKEEERSDVTLLFETHCLDGQNGEVVYHEGSMKYKNQINLIELIPEKLFSKQEIHSCNFKFKAQNKKGLIHLFDFPHLPVHSFDQTVNISFHNSSTDFSKEFNLNEEMIVHFDHLKDHGYYLDVWYDNTINEIKLVCDFINHSFAVRNDERYYLFQIPGWNRIPVSEKKDQNCRLLTLSNEHVTGVSQSFYLDFEDHHINTEVVQNFDNDFYNQEILPKIDESLKTTYGFEDLQFSNFLTLKVENTGDYIKSLYIPSIVEIDKNYHFFWRNYFDRFYKEQKGFLQMSPELNPDVHYHEFDPEKGILLSLRPQQTIEIPFDLFFEKQELCPPPRNLGIQNWVRLFNTHIDTNKDPLILDLLRNTFSQPFYFFNNPLGLGVASFMEFLQPQVYEVSINSNLDLAQKQARLIDEIKTRESMVVSYSLDYKKYPGMEDSLKKHINYQSISSEFSEDLFYKFFKEADMWTNNLLFPFSKYEWIRIYHMFMSQVLYGSISLKNPFFLGENFVDNMSRSREDFNSFIKGFNSHMPSDFYGLETVLPHNSFFQKGTLNFNEFNCQYIDMEMDLFKNVSYIHYITGDEILPDDDLDGIIVNLSIRILLMDLGLSLKDLFDFESFLHFKTNTPLYVNHIQNQITSYMRNKDLVEVPSISVNYTAHGDIPLFQPSKKDMNPTIGVNEEFLRVQNMSERNKVFWEVIESLQK